MNSKELKQQICQHVDDLQAVIYGIAEYLHEHPETGKRKSWPLPIYAIY